MNDFRQNILDWIDLPGNSQAELSRQSGLNEVFIHRIVDNPKYEPGHFKALKIIEIIDPNKNKGGDKEMDRMERMLDRLERQIDRLEQENKELKRKCAILESQTGNP